MDLPIRLRFYQKLDLYQELQNEDKKYDSPDAGKNQEGLRLWNMSKAIMKWTVLSHRQLYTPLSSEYVRQRLNEIRRNNGVRDSNFAQSDIDAHSDKVLGYLYMKGFALETPNSDQRGADIREARISRAGLLMGEVIDECQDWNSRNKAEAIRKYDGFLRLAYAAIFAFLLILFVAAGQAVYNVISQVLVTLMPTNAATIMLVAGLALAVWAVLVPVYLLTVLRQWLR